MAPYTVWRHLLECAGTTGTAEVVRKGGGTFAGEGGRSEVGHLCCIDQLSGVQNRKKVDGGAHFIFC